jgi:hypothetical protein
VLVRADLGQSQHGRGVPIGAVLAYSCIAALRRCTDQREVRSMSKDKSPKKEAKKKPAKSLKEKRAEKQAKKAGR